MFKFLTWKELATYGCPNPNGGTSPPPCALRHNASMAYFAILLCPSIGNWHAVAAALLTACFVFPSVSSFHSLPCHLGWWLSDGIMHSGGASRPQPTLLLFLLLCFTLFASHLFPPSLLFLLAKPFHAIPSCLYFFACSRLAWQLAALYRVPNQCSSHPFARLVLLHGNVIENPWIGIFLSTTFGKPEIKEFIKEYGIFPKMRIFFLPNQRGLKYSCEQRLDQQWNKWEFGTFFFCCYTIGTILFPKKKELRGSGTYLSAKPLKPALPLLLLHSQSCIPLYPAFHAVAHNAWA